MDNVGCSPSDDIIQNCQHIDENRENCGSSDGAGVICNGGKSIRLRILYINSVFCSINNNNYNYNYYYYYYYYYHYYYYDYYYSITVYRIPFYWWIWRRRPFQHSRNL